MIRFVAFCVIIGVGELLAQCPVSSLSFNTQAQIDSFPIKYPACSNLGPIGLSIHETLSGDITSLVPFKQLKGKQKAEIFITGNINLTSMEGFNNIDTLENSMLVKGNSIKDISALSKLRYCKWSLTFDEDSLTDLKGLENLTSAFQLSFLNRSERTISLKSLSSLRKLNNFFIVGNYLFENISFKWVKDMRIRANNSLSSLEGIKVDSLLEMLSIHTPNDFSFEGNDRPKRY
ncbi:MAG: hypothetical protein IPN29_15705 [Saprospiraceae bacterium]|nr:hypothetical protein [Saprospiraceae bacterium]